jgi:hypothetical protein
MRRVSGVGKVCKMFVCALVLCFSVAAFDALSQEREKSPSVELLNAAKLADARAGDRGFKISAVIKLMQGMTQAEGTYQLVWDSPTRWREELSFPDFHQIRVSAPGGVWEKREPYFLSLRMWQLMQALGFYGRFELSNEESAGKIKRTKKQGSDLRCVEIKRNSYPVDEFCFHEDTAQLLSEHYLPSDRVYEFTNYRNIGPKFLPGHIAVREGKTPAADFSVTDVREMDSVPASSFEQPAQAEWRSWCASPESGGDPLTPIYSGLAQHKGTATLYGAIGTDGQWHRAHILESGGADHDTEVLEGLKKERWKPSSCNGSPIVVETVFRR